MHTIGFSPIALWTRILLILPHPDLTLALLCIETSEFYWFGVGMGLFLASLPRVKLSLSVIAALVHQ